MHFAYSHALKCKLSVYIVGMRAENLVIPSKVALSVCLYRNCQPTSLRYTYTIHHMAFCTYVVLTQQVICVLCVIRFIIDHTQYLHTTYTGDWCSATGIYCTLSFTQYITLHQPRSLRGAAVRLDPYNKIPKSPSVTHAPYQSRTTV